MLLIQYLCSYRSGKGNTTKKKTDGDFVRLIYSSTNVELPDMNNIIVNNNTIPWKSLQTGDIAFFKNKDNIIIGIVVGILERQFCYSDPQTSIVVLSDFCENVDRCEYLNGFKVTNNE